MVKKYAIVGFIEVGEPVEVIPSAWLIGEASCLWPTATYTKSKIITMIRRCITSSPTWSNLSVKIYGSSNSFTHACQKTEVARSMSSIGSDWSEEEDGNWKFLRSNNRSLNVSTRYRNSSESSYDEENQQPPPKKKGTTVMSTLKVLKNISHRNMYSAPEPPLENGANEVVMIDDQTNVNADNEIAASPGAMGNYAIQNTAADMVQTRTPQEQTLLEKVLKRLAELKNDNKELKREFKKLREKVESHMNVVENP